MPIPNEFLRIGFDKIFNPQDKEEETISVEEAEKRGLMSNIKHLGGKVPEWLKGKVLEAKDVIKEKAGEISESIKSPLSRVIEIDNTEIQEEGQISYTPEEIDMLGGIIFAESRPYQSISDEDLKDEMKSILNVAINRTKETGETLAEVLQKPDQFKGLNDPQFERFNAEGQDEFESF